ncbi:hypothetical protein G6F43_002907 [Rhizopus delemar]|nr:hypothetical protein G6F43_002907 [Rhizopus delemar]
MTDLFKSNENEFYIELKQERYYFPGEDISGDVVLDLKKSTKTNNIKVSLEGYAEIGGRTMTIYSKSIFVAEPPEGEKSYYLDAYTHRFPFKISIPSSSDYILPSTLEIPKLLKVSYRLVAVHNRPFVIMEKFCSTATERITILEDINVEKNGLDKEHNQTRELTLTGETRKVRVVIALGKRAAVKGDTIPITITIHHIGVMVRDKAIKVQLIRYVYYGKNKGELFGPKTLSETTANIEISGPVSFTKSFNLKLPIPTASACPTVEKSCDAFRIEYCIRATINLNEENPLRKEEPNDIVCFNIPFIIGTYPKLAFNIDDDEEIEEEEVEEEETVQKTSEANSSNSSEYDQVFEKMKELELNSIPSTPALSDQENPKETSAPSLKSNSPRVPNEKDYKGIKPLSRLQETPPATPTPTLSNMSNTSLVQSPVQEAFKMTPANTPPMQHQVTVISPPLDHSPISPVEHSKRENATSDVPLHSNDYPSAASSIHRQDSMRWVVRSEDESSCASTSPTVSNNYYSPKNSTVSSPTPSTLSNKPCPIPSSPMPMPYSHNSTPIAFSTPQLVPSTPMPEAATHHAFPSLYPSHSTPNSQFHSSISQPSLGNYPGPPNGPPQYNYPNMTMPSAFPSSEQVYNHHPLNPTYAYYGQNNHTPPNQGYGHHHHPYQTNYGHHQPSNVSFPTPYGNSHHPSPHHSSSFHSS